MCDRVWVMKRNIIFSTVCWWSIVQKQHLPLSPSSSEPAISFLICSITTLPGTWKNDLLQLVICWEVEGGNYSRTDLLSVCLAQGLPCPLLILIYHVLPLVLQINAQFSCWWELTAQWYPHTPPTPTPRQVTKPNPLQKQPHQQARVIVSDYLVYHFIVLIHLIFGSILLGLCLIRRCPHTASCYSGWSFPGMCPSNINFTSA